MPDVDGGVGIQRNGERFAEVGGLSLCYETFGDPTDEAVLLVMGLGLSMLYWRGLLDAIAVGLAHVVGVSLGSFIAQEVAIRHPGRTRSLVSIMGRPGDRRTGRLARRMVPLFLRPAPRSTEGAVEDLVRAFRRIGSEGRTEIDDADVRDLRRLDVPALVMHGEKDRVILPSGGVATAAAIPGAELLLVPGMGHDLARWVWPALIDGIERTAKRARSRL
jgi:pimeloyl-ACP methyl ester carboxylesterase